jgi:hypothetical protein
VRTQVKAGQLRRWIRPDHPDDKGKVFMVLGVKTDWKGTEFIASDALDLSWDFIIDCQAEWHYDDVLARDSEVVSEAG